MSVPKTTVRITTVEEDQPDPLFFRDLLPGTWFKTSPGAPVWITPKGADDAWSPEDGSSLHFDSNQKIHSVFDVDITLTEVSR